MILVLCAAWLQLQKLVKRSVMCTDDLVSVHSLCGLVEGCSAQFSNSRLSCGNAATFAICDITTWPPALSQSKISRDKTFVDGC